MTPVQGPGLDPQSVDSRLDALACLGGRPRTVEELPGGLTNVNLKVTSPRGTFVVRLSRGNDEVLGIDRAAEAENTRRAAESGVAAGVVDFRPDLGLLVIDYINGVTFDNDAFARPGTLERVAASCRALHAGPRFVADFDMFVRQPTYLATVREHGYWVPAGYAAHATSFRAMHEALTVRAEATVPCNNDLLAANFVDDGDKVWLIDYEYSGNNDACFELGNLATECALDADQLAHLVTTYYGRPLRNKIARARLQSLASCYGWALWGAISAERSTLDFDFRSWARERFDKAAAGFASSSFPQLLEEVRRDD